MITAEVTVPKRGADGMIVTMDGRFGGYALYLLRGKPVFVYNPGYKHRSANNQWLIAAGVCIYICIVYGDGRDIGWI